MANLYHRHRNFRKRNYNFSSDLSTTNIDPFKNYLTMINELKSGINNYKKLAINDVKKVVSTGQAIKEADQKIEEKLEKGGFMRNVLKKQMTFFHPASLEAA